MDQAVRFLERAESAIGLIDRVRPIGLATEYQSLLARWQCGQAVTPSLRYSNRPELGDLQWALARLIECAESHATEGQLVAARANELLIEAQMASAVGTREFIRWACVRYVQPNGSEAEVLESLARRWLAEAATEDCQEPTYRSDDRSERRSLWSVVSRRLGRNRCAAQLHVDPDLMSVAACGDSVLVIRGRTWLTERAAERIAEHEISGHLATRLAARQRHDILRCGCAGATDDEEGRALLLEERAGLMDVWRRGELGARHLACVYLRRGATFVDMVRGLIHIGAPLGTALRSVLRAVRGGGMGREIVYLPAMLRLASAFAVRPELEAWFRLGRASLSFAERNHAKSQAA